MGTTFAWRPTWVTARVPDVGVLESPDDRFVKDYYQMHSNLDQIYDLVFDGVTDTTRNNIIAHYSRVTGPFQSFVWTSVPSYLNAGSTMTVRYLDRSYKEEPEPASWKIECSFEKDI